MFPTIGADFTVPLVLQSTADAPLAHHLSIKSGAKSPMGAVSCSDCSRCQNAYGTQEIEVESETPPEFGSITTIYAVRPFFDVSTEERSNHTTAFKSHILFLKIFAPKTPPVHPCFTY